MYVYERKIIFYRYDFYLNLKLKNPTYIIANFGLCAMTRSIHIQIIHAVENKEEIMIISIDMPNKIYALYVNT